MNEEQLKCTAIFCFNIRSYGCDLLQDFEMLYLLISSFLQNYMSSHFDLLCVCFPINENSMKFDLREWLNRCVKYFNWLCNGDSRTLEGISDETVQKISRLVQLFAENITQNSTLKNNALKN